MPAGSGEASRLQEVAPLIVFVLTMGLNVECSGDRLLLAAAESRRQRKPHAIADRGEICWQGFGVNHDVEGVGRIQ